MAPAAVGRSVDRNPPWEVVAARLAAIAEAVEKAIGEDDRPQVDARLREEIVAVLPGAVAHGFDDHSITAYGHAFGVPACVAVVAAPRTVGRRTVFATTMHVTRDASERRAITPPAWPSPPVPDATLLDVSAATIGGSTMRLSSPLHDPILAVRIAREFPAAGDISFEDGIDR